MLSARGLPEDRIRFHLCWGSWHGPHTTDIPMRDIVEVMLAVKCRAYSFEAGNVWNSRDAVSFGDTYKAGSLFLGADTYIGPFYFAWGRTNRSESSFYVFVGRP